MQRKPKSERRGEDSSIRGKAYLHIQRKIASGELPAGSAVSELALAEELGSSRTPIREALGQLAAEGFLEQTPNRGAVVVQLKRQDFIDLYELREALEVYAVRKAATTPTRPSDLETLQKLADDILLLKKELDQSRKASLNPQQMQRLMNIDMAFHTLLMRMAANARILKVVNETRLLILIFAMRHQGHRAADLERIYQEHCNILRAVADRNPDRAAQLIGDHIQNSQRERLEELEHSERENSLRDSVPAFLNILQTPN
jgi:DNA-binding GntR family transcriptional regulator